MIRKPFLCRSGSQLLALLFSSGQLLGAELWQHLPTASDLAETRGLTATFDDSGAQRALKLRATGPSYPLGETHRNPRGSVAWASIPPPASGWDLSRSAFVTAMIRNTGSASTMVTLWVVSSRGGSAVGSTSTLPAHTSTTLSCKLRETYPDQTPKIDPTKIKEIRVMIHGQLTSSLVVTDLVTSGSAEPWVRPPELLEVPDMTEGEPTPGKRVRYRLNEKSGEDIYSVLYLPDDWAPDKRYPVIAELPGNLFFSAKACWSTGRPEQCVMGYGITKGQGAIWVSLPFVDRANGTIAEIGFGSNDGDDTATYTMDVIEDLCENWGGDPQQLYLSGFSRGAIACGYIGLRNDEIAKLWRGFIACQHYDGSGWRQSKMPGAVERAPRFRGEAIFQIDNAEEKYRPVVETTNSSVKWTWSESCLDYHATAMFLDDRPSTKELREWFRVQSSGP